MWYLSFLQKTEFIRCIHDWTEIIFRWEAYILKKLSIWWKRNCIIDTFSSFMKGFKHWNYRIYKFSNSINSSQMISLLTLYKNAEVIRVWLKSFLWYSVLRQNLIPLSFWYCVSRYKAQPCTESTTKLKVQLKVQLN